MPLRCECGLIGCDGTACLTLPPDGGSLNGPSRLGASRESDTGGEIGRHRCPTCGQPVGRWKPVRVCGKCGRGIGRGQKWHFVDGSRIEHRNCDDPDSYGQDYFEMKKAEAKERASR